MNSIIINTKFPLCDQSKEQLLDFLDRIRPIGPQTYKYVTKMMETARMERRLLEGIEALVSLKLAYSNERIEAACRRGLTGAKFNYSTIKNILLNNLDRIPHPPHSALPLPKAKEGVQDNNNHENLRGSSFFNL